MLTYLRSIYGHKVLSGAMANVNWNTNEAQWVYEHTGRWPAMNCFDYIHLMSSQPGGWIDYEDIGVVSDWHAQGGIVAAMWHWNVPARREGQFAFYSKDTDFDVRNVSDTTSAEYRVMVADIDRVAACLALLRDAHIPVLWRPLHEAGGKWFWWGRDAEACARLWQLMYRRFEAAGLDNLLWVWTHAAPWSRPFSEGMDYYPGDEYVDIVTFDIYNQASAQTIATDYFGRLRQECPDKMVALGECGNVATIGSQWEAGARWLFFMPWYDYGRTNRTQADSFKSTEHGHASIEWWQEAWSHDYVLSRHDYRQSR